MRDVEPLLFKSGLGFGEPLLTPEFRAVTIILCCFYRFIA